MLGGDGFDTQAHLGRSTPDGRGGLSNLSICLGYPDAVPVAINGGRPVKLLACNKPEQVGGRSIGPVWCDSYVLRTCRCNAVNCLSTRHLKPPANVQVRSVVRSAALREAIRRCYNARIQDARKRWNAKWSATKLAAIERSRMEDRDEPDRVELNVKREGSHKDPTKARGIQSHTNLGTQAKYGPHHMCFQEALKDVLGCVEGYELYPGVRVSITCGWTAAMYSEWACAIPAGWWLRERDGANWDGSMQAGHARTKLYYMRGCDSGFADHVERGVNVRGRCRQNPAFTYTSRATVKSGHNDTTSGNSLINALISAQTCHALGVEAHIIVMGDDMLAAVSRKADFDECEREFGITPEARVFADITDTTYVSACFVHVDGGYGFSALHGRLLGRQWWTTKTISHRTLAEFKHGVACGLVANLGGSDLARALASHGLQWRGRAGRAHAAGEAGWRHKAQGSAQDLNEGLRLRYGFGHAEWALVCADVERAGAGIQHHAWFDIIASVDLADIYSRPAREA